jgi:IS605 OrfB family transposase
MSKRDRPNKAQQPNRTYLFRLYPTRKQTHRLEEWLGLCCEFYNAALDERKSAYRMAGVSLSFEDQCAELPGCKEVRPELVSVPSQVLQDVVKRVDFAFDAFFRRIAVEALVVRNLLKNPKLAKSIADVSWSMFFTRMLAKAEEAGRQVVRVNPAYTSQTCSGCSRRQSIPLSVRVYECLHCGLVIHRDHNASLNILTGAFHAVRRHSRVIPEAPGSQPWGVVTRL